MVQFRLRRKRPVQAVYAQHSGAESCGYGCVRRAGIRPVVFVARGSHAAYFVPGLRDRTWPDPNDEADGRGLRVRPRLVRISEQTPGMDALPRAAGARRARAGSPARWTRRAARRSSAERWSDPAAWAAAARPCTRRDCDRRGECDGRETAMAAVLVALGLRLGVLLRPAADAAPGGRAGRRAVRLRPRRAARTRARA